MCSWISPGYKATRHRHAALPCPRPRLGPRRPVARVDSACFRPLRVERVDRNALARPPRSCERPRVDRPPRRATEPTQRIARVTIDLLRPPVELLLGQLHRSWTVPLLTTMQQRYDLPAQTAAGGRSSRPNPPMHPSIPGDESTFAGSLASCRQLSFSRIDMHPGKLNSPPPSTVVGYSVS
jgi:hypothetical protein